jgi:hypothetical protein
VKRHTNDTHFVNVWDATVWLLKFILTNSEDHERSFMSIGSGVSDEGGQNWGLQGLNCQKKVGG